MVSSYLSSSTSEVGLERSAPERKTERIRSPCSRISAGDPEKRLSPFSRNTARSATWRASSADCSTRTTATPSSRRRRTKSRSWATITGASPSDSSSTSRSRGPGAKAWARASICCWPPERSPARSPRRPASTGNSSRIRSNDCLDRRRSRRCVQPAIRRFSPTLRSGKMPRPPGMWDSPSRAMRTGELPVTSRPSKTTRPRRGGVNPEMARSKVDFPAPLVPRTARTSPASTSRSTPNRICVRP